MTVLPEVVQRFSVDATAYLAGLDAMLERTDQLAGSINAVIDAAARMSAVGGDAMAGLASAEDAAAGSTGTLDEATTTLTDAVGRQGLAVEGLVGAYDQLLATVDTVEGSLATLRDESAETAGAADVTAASADGIAASSDAAAASAGGLGSKGKLAFLAVAAAAAYSVVKAAAYQSQMTTLLTQAGVAKGQFGELSKGVLQLANQVGQSPDSLAQGLYHIESAFQSVGITGPKALRLLKIAAEGAATGHADLVDVTNALDATIAAGIPGIHGYSQAMGALNAIVGSGDMTMQDLADAMGTGLMAQAKNYGQSIDQVGAALATFGDNNIRGAKAATELRMTWQALQSPLAAGVPVLQQLGLTSTQLANTMTHHGLTAALTQFVTHLKSSHVPMSDWGRIETEVFGKRAGTGIGVLIDQLARLKGKLPDVARGADDFGKAWHRQQQTAQQQWKDFVAGLDALAVAFGKVLMPAVTKALEYVNRFITFLEKHPLLEKFAGGLAALAVTLGLVTGAAGALDVVLDANPIGLVVVAVAALAVGLYELYKHCKSVRDAVADVGHFFKAIWTDAMHAAGAVVHWFVSGPLAFIKDQLKVFSEFWKQNGAEIEKIAKAVWDAVSTIIKVDLDVIKATLGVALDVIETAWKLSWDVVRDAVKMVWGVISTEISTSIHVILDIIGAVMQLLQGHWSKAWNDIKNAAETLFKGTVTVIKDIASGFLHLLYDAGRDLLRGLINGIKSMVGSVLSSVAGIGKSIVGTFKSVLGIFSPSKVTYGLGQNVGQGLADGISSQHGAVVAAAYGLGQAADAAMAAGLDSGELHALDAYKSHASSAGASLGHALTSGFTGSLLGGGGGGGGGGGLPGAVSSAVSAAQRKAEELRKTMQSIGLSLRAGIIRGLTGTPSDVKSAIDKLLSDVSQAARAGDISYHRSMALTKWLEHDNTRLQRLATDRAKILKRIQTAEKYAQTTTQNTESWAGVANLSAVTGASSGGALYSGDILSEMKANLATIHKFEDALRKLKKLGLDRNLLNQLIQMGPQQGLQVAEALLDGPVSVIKQLDQTQTSINSASKQLGRSAAEDMYDVGKHAGQGFLRGLEDQQRALERIMEKIARAMVRTIKRELGIHSPSTVMREHGLMAAEGLALGIDDGEARVVASSKRLAAALSGGAHGGAGAAAAGGGDVYNFSPVINVNGAVASDKAQLKALLFPILQEAALQFNKRNPTAGNGLSLTQARFG